MTGGSVAVGQPERQWKVRAIATVAICLFINMLDGVDLAIIAFIGPALARDWSLGPAELGLVFSGGLVGMAIGCLFVAPLADRYGRGPLLLLALATISLSTLACGYAKTSPVKLVEPTMWHAMEAATIGGARGLGRDDLGRIQAGAKADLCTISIDQLLVGSGTRALEPLNSLLYTNGLAVRNVMTDGQWQLRDGHLLVGDEAELMKRGGGVVEKIWGRLKDQGYFDVGGHRG